MKIKKLILLTNQLELEKDFYSNTLGFKLLKENPTSFTLSIGWSELSFVQSENNEQVPKYHYCFLIPSNKLEEALQWMEERVEIISIEPGRKTQRFESWNADSFYFLDGSGNIAEFIVRHDLDNAANDKFDISQILCVNEIGLPTKDISNTIQLLERELKTKLWKGNLNTFATSGNQEGLFLLPNYKIKAHWFPTEIKIKPAPFQAVVEHQKITYLVDFRDEEISIQLL